MKYLVSNVHRDQCKEVVFGILTEPITKCYILGSEPVIIFSNFLDGSILLKGDVDLNIEQFNKTECEQ